jgi:hypothetical protein
MHSTGEDLDEVLTLPGACRSACGNGWKQVWFKESGSVWLKVNYIPMLASAPDELNNMGAFAEAT